MICNKCGKQLRVKDTVLNDENEVYRKRVCENCENVVYTIEFDVIPNKRFKREWVGLHTRRSKGYRE